MENPSELMTIKQASDWASKYLKKNDKNDKYSLTIEDVQNVAKQEFQK